jgi:pilus assembly protein CpaE
MTQLVSLIVTNDNGFTDCFGPLLQAAGVGATIVTEQTVQSDADIDLVIVDARGESRSAMSAIERLRGAKPAAAIFAVAVLADSDVILKAMQAGANEFLTWPPSDEAFQAALRRTVARRQSTQAQSGSATLVFLGAKGGSGTTTIAVNCAVDVARLSKRPTAIVDLKPSLGEVALFLGMRATYNVLDATENLARLDREFLRALMMKHKSGVDVLAGSEQFERPRADTKAVQELLRVLAQQYAYVLVDAGNDINAVALTGLHVADQVFLVATPDVPSVRNAQRLMDRLRQLGLTDRVRLLLNRTSDSLPIPLEQIESAVGRPIHHTFPSDYKAVSTALNAGVPLAMSAKSDFRTQFESFAAQVTGQPAPAPVAAPKRMGLRLDRLGLLW